MGSHTHLNYEVHVIIMQNKSIKCLRCGKEKNKIKSLKSGCNYWYWQTKPSNEEAHVFKNPKNLSTTK